MPNTTLPTWLVKRLAGSLVTNRADELELALQLVSEGVGCDLLGDGNCGLDGCNCAELLAGSLVAAINDLDHCPDDLVPTVFIQTQTIISCLRQPVAGHALA